MTVTETVTNDSTDVVVWAMILYICLIVLFIGLTVVFCKKMKKENDSKRASFIDVNYFSNDKIDTSVLVDRQVALDKVNESSLDSSTVTSSVIDNTF